MYDGREGVLEVASMVAHMPRGGAIGEYYGGALAISAEVEALWELSYILTVVNSDKPKRVKPRPMPEGVRVREEREAKKRAHVLRMAERYRGRYG